MTKESKSLRRLFVLLVMQLVASTVSMSQTSGELQVELESDEQVTATYSLSSGFKLRQKTEREAEYSGRIASGASVSVSGTVSKETHINIYVTYYDGTNRKIGNDGTHEYGNTISHSFSPPQGARRAEGHLEFGFGWMNVYFDCWVGDLSDEGENESVNEKEDEDNGDEEEEEEEEWDEEDYEEDNDAKEESGFEDYIIPIGIGVIILGGGAAVASKKRKKKKAKTKTKTKTKMEPEKGDEEEKQPDQLRMEVHKDFGDTLVVGDKPQQLSARIVRYPAEGPEYVDMELTKKIQIVSGDDYLDVQDAGIAGDSKCAFVSAPECEGAVPQEGIVDFRMVSEGGSYTNHLHFKIMKGSIGFAQENLTFPNGYKKEVHLPFVIVGMDDNAETNIELSITDKDGALSHDYELELEWNEEKRMHFAVITDVINPESPWAKGIPGEYVAYCLHVKAISGNGFEIEGTLPLLRFYMGLYMLFNGDYDVADQKNDIPCFLQLYDPVHHRFNRRIMMDKQEYTTAETRCWVRLWDYDDETGDVFMIEPVLTDDGFQVKSDDKSDQELIDKLGLEAVPQTSTGGHISYTVHCSGGVLNAPNRLIANVHVKCKYREQLFEFDRPVLLASQPVRHFENSGDAARAVKKDEEIKEKLLDKLNTLNSMGLTEMYAPLVVYMELQLRAYTKYYGYDERCVRACLDCYNKVIQGEALADQQQVLANDSLPGVLKMWIDSYHQTVQDCPMFLRVLTAVASFGVAPAVDQIAYGMKDYVEKGGDSFFGTWYVGAKVAVWEYIYEKAIMATAGFGTILVKNWNQKVGWDLAKKIGGEAWDGVKGAVANEINSVKNFRRIEQAAEEIKTASKASKQAVGEVLEEGEKAIKAAKAAGKSSNLSAIQEFGKQRAIERLQDLQTAMEMLQLEKSVANERLFKQILIKVQRDKYAMMMLKNPKGVGKEWIESISKEGMVKTLSGETLNVADAVKGMRSGYNTNLRQIYKETHTAVRNRLAAKAGIHPDDIMITNASSSKVKKLLDGDDITFDQDITYYYYHPKTGEIVRFEQELTRSVYNSEFYKTAMKHTMPPAKQTAIQLNKQALEKIAKNQQRLANKYAESAQQTVIQDVKVNPESYGAGMKGMTDRRLWHTDLKDVEKVAEAVTYKGKSRFAEARKMLDEAENIVDDVARKNMQADALNEVFEGCRSNVKTFDIIDGRDAQRIAVNGARQVSEKLRKGIDTMRELTSEGTTDIDVMKYALEKIGYTLDSICDALGDAVRRVG